MNIEFEVMASEQGISLGSFLRKRQVSLRVIRSLKCVQDGLQVNNKTAKTNIKLSVDDKVTIKSMPETQPSVSPQDIPISVVYRSMEALVVEKPIGMVTHPVQGYYSGTLANAVCGFLQRSTGSPGVFRPIGRLDRNTSGLALCALHPACSAILAKSMQKTYMALVGGRLKDKNGVIKAPLCADVGSAVRQRVHKSGKESCTEYEVIWSTEKASLVKVRPLSGRTHQIRAHFAYLGHPLLGDELYEGDMSMIKRHALHCAELSFIELSGNRPCLHSQLPNDMKMVQATLCKS